MDTTTQKDKLARFGRAVALLFNRSLMYQRSHPMVQDSIKELVSIGELIFFALSPIVFILNRGQFYIDEEPLDPRLNVQRIATLFKNHGIQSVSFESGMTTSEVDIFIDIFSSMDMSTNAEDVKKMLFSRGAYNIKVNHVLYKKVTEDDQVVSRDALKSVTPTMESEDSQSRKKFMDTLLESILTEEFANTLNIKSLLANPSMVSKNMVAADKASAQKMGDATSTAGGDGSGGSLGTGPGGEGGPGTGAGPGMGPGGGGGPGTGAGPGMGPGGGGGPGTGAGPGMGPGGGGGPGTGAGPGMGPGMGPGGRGDPGMGTGSGPGAGPGGGPGMGPGGGGGPGTGAGPGMGSGMGPGDGMGDSAGGGAGGAAADVAPGDATGDGEGIITDMAVGEAGHGPMLLHQLELMQQEVQKQLEGGGDASLEELADAVFEMKKQLFEEIQTQKALGIAYTNEATIVQNVNELTDQVLIKLVQEEYQDGNITPKRLAQIILRLIPDAQELKRLLPKIKNALMQSGMEQETYLEVIEALKSELQNEDLSRILEESAEAIGVDSEELVEELKESSGQAAKLIYLASEIRKGTGDEGALADILVDYVEEMGREAAKEGGDGQDGDAHLKKVVSNVESSILQQLSKLNVGDDVLHRMEDRINNRMDSILDKMRVEWLNAQAGAKKEKQIRLTVLQTIEHSVGEDEELEEILKIVREKVEAGEIEENNFSQINAEIELQKKRLAAENEGQDIPEGVLTSSELMFILEKEIARANRYNAPFSALAFSFVNAKPTVKALNDLVTPRAVMAAALDKLVNTIREVDYIGQIGKNKMVALLPMIALPDARLALGRVLNLLHAEPIMVKEVPVQLRVAGVVSAYDEEQSPNAQVFAKKLSNQLMDMVSRVKSIQVLF